MIASNLDAFNSTYPTSTVKRVNVLIDYQTISFTHSHIHTLMQ